MAKPIKIDVPFYAMHAGSFQELMKAANHASPTLVIKEALKFYDFYEENVDTSEECYMVVFQDMEDRFAISDDITEDHQRLEDITVFLTKEELTELSDNNPDEAADRISRSLILFDHIIDSRGQNMRLGLYNAKAESLATLRMSNPGENPAGSGQLPPSMVLQ